MYYLQKQKNPLRGSFVELFDDSGFRECCECAVLLDGAKTASRNFDCHRLLELRNVDRLLLEVRELIFLRNRREDSRTSSVRVLAGLLRSLICYWADFCHM